MLSLISLIVVLSISLLVTRIAAILLTYTGLSKDVAGFQARSAFTGVGFTTNEAESIVNHPVRRQIIRVLMLVGNAGVISAMASLILAFVGDGASSTGWWIKVLILFGSIAVLWLVGSSKILERKLESVVHQIAKKYTSLKVRDYANLLHLSENYEIYELNVKEDDWLAGKDLRAADLRSEGINVLGIKKTNGDYIGVPNGESVIEVGDNLLLYGREEVLKDLDERKTHEGEERHQKARQKQQEEDRKQNKNKQKRKTEKEAESKKEEVTG